jgi:hypothetical protein
MRVVNILLTCTLITTGMSAPFHQTCVRGAAWPLVFLHHAKCAGTTVRSFLLDIAREHGTQESQICDDLALPRMLYEDPTALHLVRDCMLVVGHVAFGLAYGYAAHPHYATVLRDPIARTLSLYAYVRRFPDHHQHRSVI